MHREGTLTDLQANFAGVPGLLTFYDRLMEDRATVARGISFCGRKVTRLGKRNTSRYLRASSNFCSGPILAHYDPNNSLVILSDVSSYGVEGVLAQEDRFGACGANCVCVAYAGTGGVKLHAVVMRETYCGLHRTTFSQV